MLSLNSTGIYWWYITLHYKYHMVGYVGSLYGSTFSMVKSPRDPTASRIGWFKISMTKVTMLDDDDYRYALAQKQLENVIIHQFFFRCDDSGSEVNLEKCLENYMESDIGCSWANNSDTADSKLPVCNESKYHEYLKTYSTIIEAGESEINKITGCVPRFN